MAISHAPTGVDPTQAVRCSDWARSACLSPVGTMSTSAGFLLVEIPLPWPRDVGQTPEGAAVAPLIAPHGFRLQAVLPEHADAPPAHRRIVLHAPQPGVSGFAGYRRLETRVGHSIEESVADLVAAAAHAAPGPHDTPGIDILVCTHGTRDGCCGRHGASLAKELAVRGAHRRHIHLWRTSHTGGHRFAPTFVLLPEGTSWGFADTALVDRVMRRQGDVGEVVDHYRGCTGLGGPQQQALEAEVLRHVGWSLLSKPRTGTFDGTTATLSWTDGGETITWAGEVHPGRTLPMPACREIPAASTKTETEWTATAVRRL